MTESWRVICSACHATIAWPDVELCGACDESAIIQHETRGRGAAFKDGGGVWRYADWLPLPDGAHAVTLGEGATPIARLGRWADRVGLSAVCAKLESCCPTGSFKDRGAAVLASVAAAQGAQVIVEDSSGNAGAAIAAYAARAGLTCRVFVPAATAEPKLRQMRAYGADLTLVPGSRAQVEAAARQAARIPGVCYAGHNTNPFFVEGMKTVAYELVDAFNGAGPDHVVIPVGGGSLFVGAGLGFRECLAEGRLTSHPKLHLVQATACMPLVTAWQAGLDRTGPCERQPTVAGGIEIERPARGGLILRMLRASNGQAIAVDDGEILMAQRQLAELEGIYMEPTSAAAFAGLARLATAGVIDADESVVVIVTGSGLKSS